MNSYQTANAAFVAAGQTAKEGQQHGVSYHAATATKFRFDWKHYRANRERADRKTALFGALYGTPRRTQSFFDTLMLERGMLSKIYFDTETIPLAPVKPIGKWGSEDKQRQLNVLKGRDQSEDRPAPKFLVEGFGLNGGYRVVRARDRKTIITYTGTGAAESAVNQATLLEEAQA